MALIASTAGKISAVLAEGAPAVGILADGNAAVTGFSGTRVPASIPPGVNPDDKTYIDLAGPSLRVIDLHYMGAPPQAQLVTAPKPYTATAAQIGQVFAVTLDRATRPNIYVAATSAFGLPIVVPDADGDGLPDRAKQGSPSASFMPGLFGPAAQGGGPGSIWRIDGTTGAVRLFANVTLGGAPNSGPALGGLAFDRTSSSLYVADRDTGMIHRFDLTGAERGVYDHGAQGRPAAGLPAVPHDPAKRLDITNPLFKTEDPGTWAYAPPQRLIFGLAVHHGRLFYAVADGEQIWSVALAENGSFGSDARIEVQVPPGPGVAEISRITFDPEGRMLLAERPLSTGSYDFDPLAQEGVGRVLRYAPVPPSGPGAPPTWQPVPDEYAIGFPGELRNDNGGTAVGYGYDSLGRLNRQSCGFLWSTGEQLRNSADPALAARLATGGTLIVNGLQGNGLDLVRPANVPPLLTYFIDYNDHFDAADVRGHLGDIVIRSNCRDGRLQGLLPLPVWPPGYPYPPDRPPPPPPPLTCPPGTSTQVGLQCCPDGYSMDASGVCKSYCPAGVLQDGSPAGLYNLGICTLGFDPRTFDPGNKSTWVCVDGAAPNPDVISDPNLLIASTSCVDHSPEYNPPVCKAGYAKTTVGGALGPTGNPALDNMTICWPTPQQLLCVHPEQVSPIDGQCHLLCPNGNSFPTTQCCPIGSVPNPFGQCTCADGKVPNPISGKCTSPIVYPIVSCGAGTVPLPGGGCCARERVTSTGYCCGPNQRPTADRRQCELIPGCPESQRTVTGQCCPANQRPTADRRRCEPIETCPESQRLSNGQCCPADQRPSADRRRCEWIPPPCPESQRLSNGYCCPADQKPSADRRRCEPIQACPESQRLSNGYCCPANQRPSADRKRCEAVCPESQRTSTGVCCPADQRPSADRRRCEPVCPESQRTSTGQCCPQGQTPSADRRRCEAIPTCPESQRTSTGQCCPAGQKPSADRRRCEAIPTCPESQRTSTGQCCPAWLIAGGRNKSLCICRDGSTPKPGVSGPAQCVQHPTCPPGQHLGGPNNNQCLCPNNQPPSAATGQCVTVAPCPPGTKRTTPTGPCLCPSGKAPVAGKCEVAECRPGYRKVGGSCCLVSQITTSGICCPSGQKPQGAQCVSTTEPPKKPRIVICTGGKVPDGRGNCITPIRR